MLEKWRREVIHHFPCMIERAVCSNVTALRRNWIGGLCEALQVRKGLRVFEAAVPASPQKEKCLHGTGSLRVYSIFWNSDGYAFNKNG